jgi:hypothetical protein
MSALAGESKADASGIAGVVVRRRHATWAKTVWTHPGASRATAIGEMPTLGACPRRLLVPALDR